MLGRAPFAANGNANSRIDYAILHRKHWISCRNRACMSVRSTMNLAPANLKALAIAPIRGSRQ